MKKTIVIIMSLLLVSSAVAWNSNPTYNPFEVIWNAINGMDSTPDTIADDNIISATEVDQRQIQLRVTGICALGSSIRAISQGGYVTCEPDDTGITSETDPQVASTTSGKWCRGTGTQVTCDQSAPSYGSIDFYEGSFNTVVLVDTTTWKFTAPTPQIMLHVGDHVQINAYAGIENCPETSSSYGGAFGICYKKGTSTVPVVYSQNYFSYPFDGERYPVAISGIISISQAGYYTFGMCFKEDLSSSCYRSYYNNVNVVTYKGW